jgi:type IX secretion system PorP/SprF family membrane protein
MSLKSKLLLAIFPVALLSGTIVRSQDIQFSQFYGSPLYFNPAFAGSAHHWRGIFQQRLQWPSLDAKYVTSLFSADGYFNDHKSGLGLVFVRDMQGANIMNSSEATLQYSYELHLSSKYTFRFGLQGSLYNRSLNYSHLTFPDQYNTQIGFTGNPTTDNLPAGTKTFGDFGAGGVFYENNLFVGLSAKHINQPNQSFTGIQSKVPTNFDVIAGYKIPIIHKKHMAYLEAEKDISITPTAHYKAQGKSDQLDLGVYGIYDQLMFALWYRGLPVKHYETGLQNNESMAILAGWSFNSFQIAYSYDFIVSKLRPARTGGAHEITLTFIAHKHHKNNKPMRVLPCPTFYKKHNTHQHHLQHHEENEEHRHQQFHH